MAENAMVGWRNRLNGHEFVQTLGDSERQGSLGCCSPWGQKELDMTEQLNSNSLFKQLISSEFSSYLFPVLISCLVGKGRHFHSALYSY